MPGLWLGLTSVATLISLAYVAFAACNSESAGIRAAGIVALPLGMFWGGMLAAIIVQFAWKKASSGVRIAGPIGCGCLGGIILLVLVLLFFAVIFPAL